MNVEATYYLLKMLMNDGSPVMPGMPRLVSGMLDLDFSGVLIYPKGPRLRHGSGSDSESPVRASADSPPGQALKFALQ